MPRKFLGNFDGQLHELPKDIWQLAISWLDRPSLVNFVFVCKYFRDTVKCDDRDLYGCKKLMYGPPQSCEELLLRKEAPGSFEKTGFKPHRVIISKNEEFAHLADVYTFHPDGTYVKRKKDASNDGGYADLGVYYLRMIAPRRFGLIEVRKTSGFHFGGARIKPSVEMLRFPLWGLGSETPRISPMEKEKNDTLEVVYEGIEPTQTLLRIEPRQLSTNEKSLQQEQKQP